MKHKLQLSIFLGLCWLWVAPAWALSGLPDFTSLVDDTAAAVVNIRVTTFGGDNTVEAEDLRDQFRRYFGPDLVPDIDNAPDRQGSGSGFIVESDGYIITNHHVIDGADQIIVRLADRRELEAELVGSDPRSDIALLKINARGLPTLKFGSSDNLKRGQWVLAIGSPFDFEQTVTAGIISGKDRSTRTGSQRYVPFIQTDVAINQGNSGGPLLNLSGEVVGVNSWILSNGAGGYIGLSFSIPSEVVQDTAEQLRKYGKVTRGSLGVEITDVTREQAQAAKLDRPIGALVNRVIAKSAAEKAGIEVGDVIVEFNGRNIERSSDLPPIVGAVRPGTRAELVVHRWGKRKQLKVVLDELDGQEVLASNEQQNENSHSNRLGLVVREIDRSERNRMGDIEGGVLVTEVESREATRAGLRDGDVLLMVNDVRIDDLSDFDKAVDQVRANESIAVLIWRGGVTRFVAYTPASSD